MTVKQLIDVLKNFDEDLHVVVSVCYEYEIYSGDIIDQEKISLNSEGNLEIRAIDF